MIRKRNHYKFSKDFTDKLTDFSAGFLTGNDLTKLINTFEAEISGKPFSFSAESNLLRIITNMFDKAAFLQDCLKYPTYISLLTSISLNSNYLTDILVRNPELFYRIINSSYLKTEIKETDFTKFLDQTLSVYNSFQAKVNALRTIKRREMLRIGTKDVLGLSDLKEITFELSVLAKSIADKLFSLCYKEILTKNRIKNINRQYCLIALGKLGGSELNYSSDIDLIIFYDKDSVINQKHYSEILTEAIKLFIESATRITGAGYIYRIDFRLRPDGRNSPLARSINEYINYYESRGEDWERQMLIKASFLGGSKLLYNKLMNYLAHFIYPSTFSVSPAEQIKNLKEIIERKADDSDIKLIPGGIRDIEFSVQALQLINGGKYKSLRTGNTLEAIEELEKVNLLNKNETDIFRDSYILFRKIEHFLQLMNDTQTHTIPEKGETLEKLAHFLGFNDSSSFKKFVSKQRTQVRKIFNSITGIKSEKSIEAYKDFKINFLNEKKAKQDLKFLREGIGLLGQKRTDKSSLEAFRKIEPVLLNYLKKSLQPDIVLQNFVRIIRGANFPSIWYNAFSEKSFFLKFLNLIEYSQKSVDLFAEDKELREYFLSKKVFERLSKDSYKNIDIKKLQFILSAQMTLGMLKSSIVSKHFCNFFRHKISKLAKENIPDNCYFIAGLGSFGSGEMTFASDIDLIFIVDKIDSRNNKEKTFQNLLHLFRKEFNPFTVDCRLRPEGKSSLLVWEFNSYLDYINDRARTWELQAFSKLDYICGNKKLFNLFKRKITLRVEGESKKKIKEEIKEMRNKIYRQAFSEQQINLKKSRGGLADIEFLVQYIILQDVELFKKCIGKPVEKIISLISISKKSLIEVKILIDNYRFLKDLEFYNQLIFNNTLPVITDDDSKVLLLAKKCGLEDKKSGEILLEEFKKKLNLVLKNNHKFFNKYLNGSS